MTSIRFLGAAGTVTGSRYLVQHGQSRVLVDTGLFQGMKDLRLRNRAPWPVPPETIDAVVLTHAHVDHTGALPMLVRDGFRGLMENRTVWLDEKTLSGILTHGGTILGTSRDKPYAMPVASHTKPATRAGSYGSGQG